MNGVDRIRTPTRRRSLKERLGLKSMGCCGTTWSFRPNTINLSDSEDEEQHHEHQQEDEEATNQVQIIDPGQVRSESTPDRDCLDRSLIGSGMNLAAALAAERHYRAAEGSNNAMGPSNNENGNAGSRTGTAPGTPLRVSLMRLLAESNGCDGEGKAGGGEGVFEGVVAKSRLLSPLQPFDPRDSRYFLVKNHNHSSLMMIKIGALIFSSDHVGLLLIDLLTVMKGK
ncbi:uncharacterized protein LOC116137629 [Pistacia vera]|uniref:uncharacterized protein LOC116137629 n=1 Tax=Pistacia vera TaxID=55513 RepID=UPI0012639604|nr:uncharacterized protein LOC116137629 [Pistacia vera]